MLKNTKDRYGLLSKSFHWIMAIMIFTLLVVGFYMTDLPLGPDKLMIYGYHKAFGITVLFLVLLRFIWRLSNHAPTLPSHYPLWQRMGAHMAHYGLYFCMILMPMSGWLMSSAAEFSVSVFGLFTMPDLIAPNKAFLPVLKQIHMVTAFGLMGLIAAHIGAGLYHHFILKDSILMRMIK